MDMAQTDGVVCGSGEVAKPENKPRITLFIYLLSFVAVIGGFLFGYDTGIVSSTMLYVPKADGMTPMSSIWKELIVSITAGVAALCALLAGPSSDRFGRKIIIIFSSIVFIIGAVVCAIAPEKITLFAGRVLLGVAIGFSSVTVPVYVGEIAPAHIRGLLVTSYQLLITFGLMGSNIIAGCFSYIDPEKIGWRLMFAFAGVPAIIQLIGMFFLPESPRWLYERGRAVETEKVLERVYGDNKDWIVYELQEISKAHNEEKRLREESGGIPPLIRIFLTPHVRKALIIGFLLQSLQQLSGINTIMYYTATIVRTAGIRDEHEIIWISVGISGVNFLATFIPIWTIERLGRRKLLLISVAGVFCTLVLMAIAFLLVNKDSALTTDPTNVVTDISAPEFEHCKAYGNCDFCVTDEKCGFCEMKGVHKSGYCLPINEDEPDYSTIGPCTDPYNETAYEFGDEYCHTKYTAFPIVVMIFYLSFFAIGYAPLPWVLNVEFYPLWARSTCCAFTTFADWTFDLVISLTFLTLSQAVTKYGAFFIYAGITFVAFFFFLVVIPETKGLQIEEVERIFMNKKEREKADGIQNDQIKMKQNGIPNGISNNIEKL